MCPIAMWQFLAFRLMPARVTDLEPVSGPRRFVRHRVTFVTISTRHTAPNRFKEIQVADAGDVPCNPYSITESIDQIESAASELLNSVGALISLGR